MNRITHIVGARPQFIKAAMLVRHLRGLPGVTQNLIHTGQHYDLNMSGRFFGELGLPQPDHNLGIGSGSHGMQTGRALEKLDGLFQEIQPDAVVVYGDTNATLAGALAAAKLHIPIAHVEAGLRSFNRRMPEEINRIVADQLSRWLFVPSESARINLEREGIAPETIFLVGDIMFDAVRHFAGVLGSGRELLREYGVESGDYLLVTIHRAENTGDPARLKCLVDALDRVAAHHPVLFPVHPRTKKALSDAGIQPRSGEVRLVDPAGYLPMQGLEHHAGAIATDSGGVQKEAAYHGVPCAVLRSETEWVELVSQCGHRLLPLTEPAKKVSDTLLEMMKSGLMAGTNAEPYGSGDTARRIAECLFPPSQ